MAKTNPLENILKTLETYNDRMLKKGVYASPASSTYDCLISDREIKRLQKNIGKLAKYSSDQISYQNALRDAACVIQHESTRRDIYAKERYAHLTPKASEGKLTRSERKQYNTLFDLLSDQH